MHLLASKRSQPKESGSALLIVMMLMLLLIVIVTEISFSAQTSLSIAKNQLLQAQFNSSAETGFAYAYNIIQIHKSKKPKSNLDRVDEENPDDNLSIFNSGDDEDFDEDDEDDSKSGPSAAWQNDFPIVKINEIQMKMKISLEEAKINLNRLVNSEDKVDIRIRSAVIELFENFEGTEEDVDRIIDYIDRNSLGQHESNAINSPMQSISEIFLIPNITVRYSLDELEDEDDLAPPSDSDSETTDTLKDMVFSDIFTVKSTGRLNVNFAIEEVINSMVNNKNENAIKSFILQTRKSNKLKSLNQLAFNRKFKNSFKKLANYLTVGENTFKVKLLMKTEDSDHIKAHLAYIYRTKGPPIFIYRSEKNVVEDIELFHDGKAFHQSEDDQIGVSQIHEK
ncbi:MAG: hypothetical protein COA79_24695 [Planctomycetota bacterium]|nr:MAG: hypothetical protein COA79_24695 [Planctomycetota bacterium]